MNKFLTLMTLLITLTGFSQSGKVIDENGEPLPFVNIYSYKHKAGTTSDINGVFNINVPEKTDLVFSFVGYETDTIEFKNDMVVTLMEMELNLDELVIVTDKVVGSEATLINDRKETVEVESSIGSKELTRKNISNAEDGVKKISGVTIKSSKINVRGLDDRYNQVTVNKFPIPSNNTDQKNIDLGLIPKTFIGNIKVRKTYTPNQWSNIGGAQIDINTNNIDTGMVLKYKMGFNSNDISNTNNSIGFNYGKDWGKFSMGLISRFSNNYQYLEGFTRVIDRQGNIKLNYDYESTTARISNFGSLLLQYRPSNDLKFKSVSMYVNSKTVNRTYYQGFHFDYSNEIFTERTTPTESHLFLQQLIGEYEKGKFNTHIDLSYSMVSSGEKDRNQFVYLVYPNGYRFNNIDKLDNHHFWSTNIEHRYGYTMNTKYKTKRLSSEIGYSFLGTRNKFDYEQFFYDMYGVNLQYNSVDPYKPYSYIEEDNHTLNEVNNPASLVEGETLIHGLYNVTNLFFEGTLVSFGLRFENSYQGITYKDQIQPSIDRKQVISSYELLPSLLLKKKINDKNQIKLSSSRTTIRPRFRELTPFLYTEMFAGSKIQGNPELQNSSVYNTDLSYEFYPSYNQLISFTVFGKYISSPIERVNIATASGRLETYQNSEMAYVFGGEIESKISFGDFVIDCNLSVIHTQIVISDNGTSSTIVTNKERPLQGSTPILSNIDVFYKNFGVVYTYTGKKLYSAGIQGIGDVYQSNRSQLNLVYKYEKNKIKITTGLNNILNSPFVLTQGSDDGIREVSYYKLGLLLSAGVTYLF